MTTTNYSELSITLTKEINKVDKKKGGIFFTPPTTIIKNIEFLEPYLKNIKTILEPSAGSCEYIKHIDGYIKDVDISGIEYNETIFNSIKNLTLVNNIINIENEDFLTYTPNKKYDLIIGNPPYFVMKKKDVNSYYYDYFSGRPNIFILFIIKSLKLLNQDGILSFVLPKSFLNCLYYDKTRKYINDNFTILNIIECEDEYIETKQETIILIIQNKKDNSNNKYILDIHEYIIFGSQETITELKILYEGSKSLYELNFNVSVGNITWNEHKPILTDDATKTLLIYSSDITNNELDIKKYKNIEKKNYINKQGYKGSTLVINRGYGVGKYKFNYCLINRDEEYLIENHLISIKCNIENDELYNNIMKSFNNKKTKRFIKLYFGNNAINTTELKHILPIY